MRKQIGVAIIGLGWWGRIIAGLLQGNRKLAVACAVDVSPESRDFASRLNIPFRENFDSVLSDAEIGAVILCTPHSRHCEQIVRAANAKKHVFCEKPLSLTRADAVRAVAACNANGDTLGVLVTHKSGGNSLIKASKNGQSSILPPGPYLRTWRHLPMPPRAARRIRCRRSR